MKKQRGGSLSFLEYLLLVAAGTILAYAYNSLYWLMP